MRLLNLFLCAAIVLASSCAPNQERSNNTTSKQAESHDHHDHHDGHSHNHHSDDEWNTHETEDYRIDYPASWQASGGTQMGADFYAVAPLDGVEDKFRENVSLLVQNVDDVVEAMTLEDFAALSEEQIMKLMTEAEITESEKVTTEGRSYQKMVFTAKQGVFDLKFQQHSFVENGQAFILAFSAERDKFEDYGEIGQKILDSFSVK